MHARGNRNRGYLRLALAVAFAAGIAAPAFAQDDAAGESVQPAKPMGPGGPSGRSKPPSAAAPASPAKSSKSAPSGIQLARRAPVSASVNVHDKVLDQCNLETVLPQLISEKNPDVHLVDRASGTHLELRIVDVHAPNGGVFSGPKWITVEGKLLSGKTVKGDFVVKESSMASATACGMLTKVMTVIAGDISRWLEHPTKGARLGHAR